MEPEKVNFAMTYPELHTIGYNKNKYRSTGTGWATYAQEVCDMSAL